MRGLKAPARSTVAPAARTARAAAMICSSLSTEQGPAMTTTSAAADPQAARQRHDGGFRLPLARDLLVGLGDVEDLGHAGERREARAVHPAVVADQPDGGPLAAGHRPALVAHLGDHLADPLDFLGAARRGA